MKSVAIIGSSGRLGGVLVQRVTGVFSVFGITSGTTDLSVLETCQYLVLATPPSRTLAILSNLRSYLHAQTQIFSFVADLSKSDIESVVPNNTVTRLMTDITGHLNAFYGIIHSSARPLVEHLFHNRTYISLISDEELNLFTRHLVLATVISTLARKKVFNVTNAHIVKLHTFLVKKHNIPEPMLSALEKYIATTSNPVDLLKEFQTPGGLSARLITTIQANGIIEPDILLQSIC